MKEKCTKDLSVKIQPSLFKEFSEQCQENRQTVSEVIRSLMHHYVKNHGENKQTQL